MGAILEGITIPPLRGSFSFDCIGTPCCHMGLNMSAPLRGFDGGASGLTPTRTKMSPLTRLIRLMIDLHGLTPVPIKLSPPCGFLGVLQNRCF